MVNHIRYSTSEISRLASIDWDVGELVGALIPDRPGESGLDPNISSHHNNLVKSLIFEAEHNILMRLLPCFQKYLEIKSNPCSTLDDIMEFHFNTQKSLREQQSSLDRHYLYDLNRSTDVNERKYITALFHKFRVIGYLLVASLFNWNKSGEYEYFKTYEGPWNRNHGDGLVVGRGAFSIPYVSRWKSEDLNEIYSERFENYFLRIIELLPPDFFQELEEQGL